MGKVLVIYHRVDLDGKCSAAIAAGAFPDCDFYGWNHYEDIDWQLIGQYELVIMVDISFPEQSDMERLDSGGDFIWIDHHKTSIEKYCHLNLEGLQEIGKGACQLCWEYFFPHIELPRAVKLLADYDIFDHSDPDAIPFQYGMRFADVKHDTVEIWKALFLNDMEIFNPMIEAGKICRSFEQRQNRGKARNAFELDFEGKRCIALNSGGGGSLSFESVNGVDYDIMMLFTFNGEFWIVTMFNDDGNTNVGEIARQFGGGGHAGAAGFKTNQSHMMKILSKTV